MLWGRWELTSAPSVLLPMISFSLPFFASKPISALLLHAMASVITCDVAHVSTTAQARVSVDWWGAGKTRGNLERGGSQAATFPCRHRQITLAGPPGEVAVDNRHDILRQSSRLVRADVGRCRSNEIRCDFDTGSEVQAKAKDLAHHGQCVSTNNGKRVGMRAEEKTSTHVPPPMVSQEAITRTRL